MTNTDALGMAAVVTVVSAVGLMVLLLAVSIGGRYIGRVITLLTLVYASCPNNSGSFSAM